jgi:hypothetical protein
MPVYSKKRIPTILVIFLFIVACNLPLLRAQENEMNVPPQNQYRQDTNKKPKPSGKSVVSTEPVDTNFTYEKYADFLKKISDTSKYIVLPINEFRKTFDSNKIVIGLRHDVDNDLKVAVQFSKTEKDLGFRSTYYILHTANYYLADPGNKAVHSDSILPILREMQNNSGFEIGWHNDLVTLQVVYHIDPVNFLHQELNWLRNNGIKIVGTSSHGSPYCKVYHYLNYYFFDECTWPIVEPYVNNISVPDAGGMKIKKAKLSDFNLEYEAYFLNNNKYFSDASITNGVRWNIGMLDLNSLKKGDRVIILLHPIHWHKGSTEAEFVAFSIPGQKGCIINEKDQTITVVMPVGTDKRNLIPSYQLTSGSYVKVSGSMQTSGISKVNFNKPVTFTVYAENRSVTEDWTVIVDNSSNNTADIETFTIPGYTKQVSIDPVNKSILAKVFFKGPVTAMPVEFTLSAGATAWIGSHQQLSNSGSVDFSNPVKYKVLAEDGFTVSQWTVKVEMVNNKAANSPGTTDMTDNKSESRKAGPEVRNGQLLYDLPALFELSSDTKACINGIDQNNRISVDPFYTPVFYKVNSVDSMTFNSWNISASYESFLLSHKPDSVSTMSIYPNPSGGTTILKLTNITGAGPWIEIFNSMGRRIYYSIVQSASLYFKEIDLTDYPCGIYIARCSSVTAPAVFLLDK